MPERAPSTKDPALGASLRLVADVFEHGFTSSTSASLQSAGLGCLVPDNAGSDAAATRHQEVLGYDVLPYAGVFLGEEGLADASHLGAALLSAGAVFPDGGLPVDLAGEVRLLARMVEAGAPELPIAIANHTLGWIPAFTEALKRNGAQAYAEASELLEELLLRTSGLEAETRASAKMVALPGPEAGLKDLAEFLARHANTGMYLGRTRLGTLARQVGIPRGFGSSARMLENLLRSAAHYDSLRPVIALLHDELDLAERAWQSRATIHQVYTPWTRHWVSRVDQTRQLLDLIASAPMGD